MKDQQSTNNEMCSLCKKKLDLSIEERWISCNSCSQNLHFRHLLAIQADSSCSLCKNLESLRVFDRLTQQTMSIANAVQGCEVAMIDPVIELEGQERQKRSSMRRG